MSYFGLNATQSFVFYNLPVMWLAFNCYLLQKEASLMRPESCTSLCVQRHLLRGQFNTILLLQQKNSNRTSTTSYDQSHYRFMDQQELPGLSFILQIGLYSNQNVFGFPVPFMSLVLQLAYLAGVVIIIAHRVHNCIVQLITFLHCNMYSIFYTIKASQQRVELSNQYHFDLFMSFSSNIGYLH